MKKSRLIVLIVVAVVATMVARFLVAGNRSQNKPNTH